jgi:hypothetical protein
MLDGSSLKGYLNPSTLGRKEEADLLTQSGEHQAIALADIKSVHFVREFSEPFALERKTFLSRPKLDGLWVRLRFRDEDSLEGIVGNNLLDMLDSGIQLTPPDLHANTLRMFIPRTALLELKVLGVVGGARRSAQPQPATKVPSTQSKLFNE